MNQNSMHSGACAPNLIAHRFHSPPTSQPAMARRQRLLGDQQNLCLLPGAHFDLGPRVIQGPADALRGRHTIDFDAMPGHSHGQRPDREARHESALRAGASALEGSERLALAARGSPRCTSVAARPKHDEGRDAVCRANASEEWMHRLSVPIIHETPGSRSTDGFPRRSNRCPGDTRQDPSMNASGATRLSASTARSSSRATTSAGARLRVWPHDRRMDACRERRSCSCVRGCSGWSRATPRSRLPLRCFRIP